MIIVSIHLRSAVTGKTTTLGIMTISNDGTSTNPKRGNYDVRLGRRDDIDGVMERPLRVARVEKYPRKAFSVWVLVARALKELGIERFADFFEDQTDLLLQEHDQ